MYISGMFHIEYKKYINLCQTCNKVTVALIDAKNIYIIIIIKMFPDLFTF